MTDIEKYNSNMLIKIKYLISPVSTFLFNRAHQRILSKTNILSEIDMWILTVQSGNAPYQACGFYGCRLD